MQWFYCSGPLEIKFGRMVECVCVDANSSISLYCCFTVTLIDQNIFDMIPNILNLIWNKVKWVKNLQYKITLCPVLIVLVPCACAYCIWWHCPSLLERWLIGWRIFLACNVITDAIRHWRHSAATPGLLSVGDVGRLNSAAELHTIHLMLILHESCAALPQDLRGADILNIN